MNKIIIAIACGSAMLTPGCAQAQTRPGLEISAETIDYSYRERNDGSLVARDDGSFGGFGGSYVETLTSGIFLRVRFNAVFGSANYRGKAEPAGESRIKSIQQSYGTFELHLGKDFNLGAGATLTPFIGAGSRYLEDESGGKRADNGTLGYDREVSYSYISVGAAARFSFGHGAALTLSGQYNRIVGGDVKSKLSTIDPILPDFKVKLNEGSGIEFAVMGSVPLGRKTLSFGPFVRRWNVDRSKSFVLVDPEGSGAAIELFEPRNKTSEVGLRVGLSF